MQFLQHSPRICKTILPQKTMAISTQASKFVCCSFSFLGDMISLKNENFFKFCVSGSHVCHFDIPQKETYLNFLQMCSDYTAKCQKKILLAKTEFHTCLVSVPDYNKKHQGLVRSSFRVTFQGSCGLSRGISVSLDMSENSWNFVRTTEVEVNSQSLRTDWSVWNE